MGNKDNLLIDSIRNGDSSIAIKLLSKNKKSKLISSGKKLNVNYQDENGMSSLHQASVTGNVEIVRLLIENGARIDLKDNKGMRALHYAATHGRLDIISLLVRCGSNCNEQAFNGDTPLHLAVQSGHTDIVYQLLHFGADVAITNTQFKSPLDLACELGKTKIVEILLQSGVCSQYLRDKGRDLIDAQLSTTCLHLAARNGHNDIIRLLILHGFDVNRFTAQGTALHEACQYGRYHSAKVLLECGIDISHSNFNEQTASDVVIRQKVGNDIKRLIKEYSEAVYAVSVEPYLDNHAGALNFYRDEFITVLEKNPTGHWRGFILQNEFTARYGYFPSNHVKLIDRNTTKTSNSSISYCAKAAISALNAGKMSRFSSTLSTVSTLPNSGTSTTLQIIEKTSLDELTCNISPVGSVDSSSKISLLSNTADSGVGTTSQKSLVYSSPPSTSSRSASTATEAQYNNLTLTNAAKANLMLQSFINQKPFYSPNEDVTVIEQIYSSSQQSVTSVSDLLRSGLNESQIIFNWLSEVNLETYYENFVTSGYDLLTIMKMTPSDLCAIGISDPIHRKLLAQQMKILSIRDLDEQLTMLLTKTRTLKMLLELIHLEQYLDLLLNQGYKALEDLYLINCEDLEEIGIKKLGHQKKFMLVIKRLHSLSAPSSQRSYDLYATVRGKPISTSATSSPRKPQVQNIFNSQPKPVPPTPPPHQQYSTKSMENLSDDNYLLVKNAQQQQSKPKPIPPTRTDSIAKYNSPPNGNNKTSQAVTTNYATLPRKRNNVVRTIIKSPPEQHKPAEYILPFANDNAGTIKMKQDDQYTRSNNVIIPSKNNHTSYVFQNNCHRKNENTNNTNTLTDIDFMLSDLNKQLDAMLEYEKAFKN